MYTRHVAVYFVIIFIIMFIFQFDVINLMHAPIRMTKLNVYVMKQYNFVGGSHTY